MFTIPNATSATFSSQAEPDSVDIDILVAGLAGTGVVSGCAATAQATPNMTVAVAAGTILVATVKALVASTSVTVTTADVTNPRFDLITASATGVSVVAGTPATNPVFPALPASSVALASVYVPANNAAVASTQIVDKRVALPTTTAPDDDTSPLLVFVAQLSQAVKFLGLDPELLPPDLDILSSLGA